MKSLSLTFFISLSLVIQSFSGSDREKPNEFLVFAHSEYKLKEFTFLSAQNSIGLVNIPFSQQNLLVLYNEHNLVADSLYLDWEIENIIPQNDSIFFVQNRKETVQCLIRNNELFINGQFSATCSNNNYEKVAMYTLPLDIGDFNIVKNLEDKKGYAISLNKKDCQENFIPFKSRHKRLNLNLDASVDNLFISFPDEKRVIKLDKQNFQHQEIALNNDISDWHFLYDYKGDQTYLVAENKNENALYKMNEKNELIFLMKLDFVPVAIFNGFLHKKTSSGKHYSHYLIPILKDERQKSILLEDVEISID